MVCVWPMSRVHSKQLPGNVVETMKYSNSSRSIARFISFSNMDLSWNLIYFQSSMSYGWTDNILPINHTKIYNPPSAINKFSKLYNMCKYTVGPNVTRWLSTVVNNAPPKMNPKKRKFVYTLFFWHIT